MTPEAIHRQMLDELPELGSLFRFDDVLGNFSIFTWEQYLAGNEDLVRRACDYVEWLLGVCDAEFGDVAVSRVFKGLDWGSEIADWIGPRTRDRLRAASWTPPGLA